MSGLEAAGAMFAQLAVVVPVAARARADADAVARRTGLPQLDDLAALAASPSPVVVFVGATDLDFGPVAVAIAALEIDCPVLVLDPSDVERWGTVVCSSHAYLDRPNVDAFLAHARPDCALFVHAHGRSDVLFLVDGRICAGPRRAQDSSERAPACGYTGACYRTGQRIERLRDAPAVLVTDACESLSIGADALFSDEWTFARHALTNGVGAFVGSLSYRNGRDGSALELARERFASGAPLWQVVAAINRDDAVRGRDLRSIALVGDPFARIAQPASQVPPMPAADPDPEARVYAYEHEQACVTRLALLACVIEPPVEDADLAPKHLHRMRALGQSALGSFVVGADPWSSHLVECQRARHKREHYLASALAARVAPRNGSCVFDVAERTLRKLGPPTISGPCDVCGTATLVLALDRGWRETRCPVCGPVGIASGPPLVRALDVAIEDRDLRVQVDTDAAWTVAVFHGAADGFGTVRRVRDAALLSIPDSAPPHVFFARVYAVGEGHVDVRSRRFRVPPR